MNEDTCLHIPSALGELVETYQKDGGEYAKVALKNFHLELPLSLLDDAHLGDYIRMELEVGIRNAHILHTSGLNGHTD